MKKRMLLKILCASLLAGCSLQSDVDEQYESRIDTYQTYYTEVLGNGHYEEESEYFSLSYEMTEVEGDGYRYYVILDEPVIAMYNVMMIAVENNIPYKECDKMVPSFGIFEDRVSLVPGQVNYQAGFAKGISISGESDEDHIDLLILVRWKNSSDQQMSACISHTIAFQETTE